MCGSSRRRPITSPPGGGTLARPSRASSGPASRNDARIRSARAAVDLVATRAPADRRAPRSARPLRARRRSPQTSSSIVSTSRMRGTFESVTGSSASRHAARIGSAPFLLPEARMRPLSGFPPSMTRVMRRRRRRTCRARIAGPWSRLANGLGDPDALHEERVAAAPRARRRGLDGRLRAEVRRGRGALARRRRSCTTSTTRCTRRSTSIRRTARRSCARRAIRRRSSRRCSPTPSTSACRATRRSRRRSSPATS